MSVARIRAYPKNSMRIGNVGPPFLNFQILWSIKLTVDEIEYLRSALKESVKSKILKKLKNIKRLKKENLAFKTFLGMTNL